MNSETQVALSGFTFSVWLMKQDFAGRNYTFLLFGLYMLTKRALLEGQVAFEVIRRAEVPLNSCLPMGRIGFRIVGQCFNTFHPC